MGRTASSPLRLAFMGTPDFAVPSLLALAEAGHEIACVYSQPPRPAKRGQKPHPSPVQRAAERHGWPLRTPESLRGEAERRDFRALALDAAVVAAYGLILSPAILTAPRLGCLNAHASLLPRWRGAAPIQRAILAGDRETGITIMQMDEGLDTGAMLLQESLSIGPETTAASLHDALAALAARLIVDALDALAAGALQARPQPAEGVTYAPKLTREEARLDWRKPAEVLDRQIRAFTPWPGAYANLPAGVSAKSKTAKIQSEERLKVLAARAVAYDGPAPPGSVLDERLTIACGHGALELLEVQRPGRAAMTAAQLLNGFPLPRATRLPLPSSLAGAAKAEP